ncbi:MAG: transposase [Planctomycetaceae bacterium]|nr:transposase [Planctomycetaceae bacterium]
MTRTFKNSSIHGAANEPQFRVLARKRDQEIPTSHVQELIVSSERPTSRGFVSWRGSAIKKFWNQPDRAAAEGHLFDWLSNAEALKISALTAFCRTLRTRLDGLLSWYAYPISTGPLEGMNNKIKTLKRRSCGFRDPTYFRLKILNIHQIRYALVG